jgi:uncharacterized protein (DUF427 family)
MGLAWQQGPLASASVGHFLTPEPLPQRLLYAEPLRRRMRVRLADQWIAESDDVVLLHEPGRYPVAYFPEGDISPGVLFAEDRSTTHPELGAVAWFTVGVTDRTVNHAAWRYTALPGYAAVLEGRVAFAWRGMDAFYEEDERIVGHAADAYHRIDIRSTSRHLVVRDGDRVVADTHRPLALYESGFAPRWYVARDDIDESALEPVAGQTFCPYKGLAQLLRYRRPQTSRVVLHQRLAGGGTGEQPGVLRARQSRRLPRRHAAAPRAGPNRGLARHRPRTRPR